MNKKKQIARTIVIVMALVSGSGVEAFAESFVVTLSHGAPRIFACGGASNFVVKVADSTSSETRGTSDDVLPMCRNKTVTLTNLDSTAEPKSISKVLDDGCQASFDEAPCGTFSLRIEQCETCFIESLQGN